MGFITGSDSSLLYRELHGLPWKWILPAAFVAWRIWIVVYRLWFHPLAHIPGPRLAAVSHMYMAYWQVYRDGLFYRQRPELFKKYGPVIRVSPSQVEIFDPDTYHVIHKRGSQFFKDPVFYKEISLPHGFPRECDNTKFRARTAPTRPMYNKSAIERNTLIPQVIKKLCNILDQYCEDQKPIPVANALYCTTIDIISAYTFGKSWEMLDTPGFESPMVKSSLSVVDSMNFKIEFSRIGQMVEALGEVFPSIVPLAVSKMINTCGKLVTEAIKENDLALSKGLPAPNPNTLFNALLNHKKTPRPSFKDLHGDAMTFIVAGTDTTANACIFALYELAKSPEAQARVFAELITVGRHPDGGFILNQLESLEYLTGIIKETFRYHVIAPARLQRIVPKDGLFVSAANIHIPAGALVVTPIDMYNRDPKIFENPDEFMPERWMGKKGRELEHWLLVFSKGDRSCFGINLVYAELYSILAALCWRYNLATFDTTDKDMAWRDRFVTRTEGLFQMTVKKRV